MRQRWISVVDTLVNCQPIKLKQNSHIISAVRKKSLMISIYGGKAGNSK